MTQNKTQHFQNLHLNVEAKGIKLIKDNENSKQNPSLIYNIYIQDDLK